MSCSSYTVLFLSQSSLLEKLPWDSTLIRIHVVIILTAMIGNLMLSSGSMGVTQLNASATGMSVPFLYTTLKGRCGKDLTMSLCTLGLMSIMFLIDTYKWLLVGFQCKFLSIQEVVELFHSPDSS